jgi:glutamate synthase (NADPH/NADH) large chain
MGNTVLYGATGGELFCAGRAGERFAVRNSGATVVVEGVGYHACEYMTRGTAVILGKVSGNFAAGMTGGVAYVYDAKEKLPANTNPETVEWVRLNDPEEVLRLRGLIERHRDLTGSVNAAAILKDWEQLVPKFWKVLPKAEQAKAAGALVTPTSSPDLSLVKG